MIFLLGLNQKVAPLDIRSIFSFSTEETSEFLKAIKSKGFPGLLLSTCNRIELYVASPTRREKKELGNLIMEWKGLNQAEPPPFYYLEGREAIGHLFKVASGLDSMVIGEPQILGQVKDAYKIAEDAGSLNSTLSALFQQTFHVAKKIRKDTGIGEGAISVSFVAFKLTEQIFDDLQRRKVLVVGAGEMSRLFINHLFEHGVTNLVVANRTREKARELSALFGGMDIPFEDISVNIANVDIVITSTGSQEPLITASMLVPIMKKRLFRPLFIVDIAVPRDVDDSCRKIDGVYLYDIDDLQEVSRKSMEDRFEKIEAAERLIWEEVDKNGFLGKGEDISMAICEIYKWADDIKKIELEQTLSSLINLNEREKEVVEKMAHRIVAKLLHNPISNIKNLNMSHSNEEEVRTLVGIFLQKGEEKR